MTPCLAEKTTTTRANCVMESVNIMTHMCNCNVYVVFSSVIIFNTDSQLALVSNLFFSHE